MKKSAGLALAAAFIAVFMAPAAAAQELPNTLTVSETDGITWVEAALSAGDHSKVQIKILQVKRGQDRVWQRCAFVFSGGASYKCGFESGSGSLAADHEGTWIVLALVDGERVARKTFSI